MKTSNRHLQRIIVLACFCVQAFSLFAQSEVSAPTIVNTKLVGIGYSAILDTYLSQEHYSGVELRFIDHTTRHADGRRWSTQLVHSAYISSTTPRSDDNTFLAGMYSFSYSRHRNWHFMSDALEVKAGFTAEANAGFLYSTVGGNNPAQARLAINVGPSAAARYRFEVGRHIWALRYELMAPIVGVMFAPNFGQSYYEIFSRGDYDNNVKLSHPFNSPSMRHMLTLEIPIRKTIFTIGYLGDYQQADVNMIKYHNYSHMLVVGLTKRFKIKDIAP